MDSIFLLLLMLAATSVVLVRSITAVASMSHITCSTVAWAWMLQAQSALWVACTILTGDAEYRPWAVAALIAAAAAVQVVDRRRRPALRIRKPRRGKKVPVPAPWPPPPNSLF